ncbi:hypothetical protein [Sphingomonas sp.]|jgi:hypothetical protein|uniref:DUF4170 domain-containing protein n=1 Tax=Sphingomonas sp. TaxID=28214 RepID=UPI0025DE72E1|nr:hypothetical protein [Sphingomonas sp.]
MQRRYWVIGGDYSDCAFGQLEPGTEKISGPFLCEVKARTEWQRLTFRDNSGATTRYTIAAEPDSIWQ